MDSEPCEGCERWKCFSADGERPLGGLDWQRGDPHPWVDAPTFGWNDLHVIGHI
jgi:hypothetical protein